MNDVVEKSVLWWKENKYTKIIRQKHIPVLTNLFGIKWKYKESIYGNYFKQKNSKIFLKAINNFCKLKNFRLGDESNLFEPGSNCGRNLKILFDRYNSNCYAFDISQEAIDILEQKVFAGIDNKVFTSVGNILKSNYLDKFEDNYFDLVFTHGFLMHLPIIPEKKKLIESLKRIAQHIIIFELYDKNKTGTYTFYNNNEYCLSYDNYESYGLKYQPDADYEKKQLRIYYR